MFSDCVLGKEIAFSHHTLSTLFFVSLVEIDDQDIVLGREECCLLVLLLVDALLAGGKYLSQSMDSTLEKVKRGGEIQENSTLEP